VVLHLPKLEQAVEIWVDTWFSTWETLISDLATASAYQFHYKTLASMFANAGANPLTFAQIWLTKWFVIGAAAFDNFTENSLVAPLRVASKLVVESLEPTETKQRVLTAAEAERLIIDLLRQMADQAVTGDLPIEARMAYYIRSRAKWADLIVTLGKRLGAGAGLVSIAIKLVEALVLRLIRLTVAFSVGIGLIIFAFVLRAHLAPGKPDNLITKRLLFNGHKRETEAVIIRRRVGGVKP